MTGIRETAETFLLSNLLFLARETACDQNRERYLDYAMGLAKQKRAVSPARRYSHIIFDLDGTLIDTEESILKAWQVTLAEYRYRFAPDELRCVLGVTADTALELLHVVVDGGFGERWIQNYTRFAAETDFFPGARQMLRLLKRCGFSLGVVTSRKRVELETYFRPLGLEEYFERIVCEDDTRRHKPDPEPLVRCAELAGVPLSSCIYIGDMPTDLECARQAGAASGLVLWNGSGTLSEDADYFFRSPGELLEQLL